MPRGVRSKRITPASRARADICWDTAEGVKHIASAAAEKLPRRVPLSDVSKPLVRNGAGLRTVVPVFVIASSPGRIA